MAKPLCGLKADPNEGLKDLEREKTRLKGIDAEKEFQRRSTQHPSSGGQNRWPTALLARRELCEP